MSEPVDRADGYRPPAPHDTDPMKDRAILDAINALPTAQQRQDALDGFKNLLTGLGDFTRDKTLGGKEGGPDFCLHLLVGAECEDRWRGSDLGRRIIERVPSEMTREGFELSVQPTIEQRRTDSLSTLAKKRRARLDAFPQQQAKNAQPAPGQQQPPAPGGFAPKPAPELPDIDDESQAIIEALSDQWKELKADYAFWLALCYRRAYGGAAILIGVDDGAPDLLTPLDPKKVKRITHLTVFRGGWDGEAIAWNYYADMARPRYGEPETYMLRNLGVPFTTALPPVTGGMNPTLSAVGQLAQGNQAYTFTFAHESRLLIFEATPPSNRTRVQMRGWGDSVFVQLNEVLSQYSQSWNGLAVLMQDWALGVLKQEGLAAMLAAQGSDPSAIIGQRALALQMSMSLARCRLIDTSEEFKRDVVPLTGVSDVFEQFSLRLAAAAGMPVSLLMGQVKGGLGDSGNTDMTFFYDDIKHWQKIGLVPQTERLISLMFKASDGVTKGVEPDRWGVTMSPLHQLTALEEAQRRKTNMETDTGYVNAGVLLPTEPAASRFAGPKYGNEITLDLEGRKEMDRMMKSEQEAVAADRPRPGEAVRPGNTEPTTKAPTPGSAKGPGDQ